MRSQRAEAVLCPPSFLLSGTPAPPQRPARDDRGGVPQEASEAARRSHKKGAAKARLEARAAEENASPLEPYRSLGDASMPSAAIDPAVTTFLSKLCDGAGSLPDSIAALIFRLAARVTRLEQTTLA